MEFENLKKLNLKKGDTILIIPENVKNKYIGFFKGIEYSPFNQDRIKIMYSSWLERLDFYSTDLNEISVVQKLGPV